MTANHPLRRYQPLPLTQVTVDDEFWAPRMRANRERTLPAVYRQLKETGRIDAFRLDWRPGVEPAPHIFWDSDVAKWIEAASYSLATHPDTALEARLSEVVKLVASAQQPDGYLNVHFTVVEPDKRWTNLRDCHELYSAGHLIEAGVAHFQATGERTLLDAVRRYADYIGSVFGTEPGKKRGYCGHEEIELALVKLYRVTGEARYLRLSEYFVRERGRQPYYFDLESRERGEAPGDFWAKSYAYCQAHAPVEEQTEVVGHAVRAMYLYCGMTDLAAESGDAALLAACQRLWEHLCLKKMYITGGIGPSKHNEGFTTPYDLPNETAYAETCAAIGLVLWNHRLLQLDCDSRYADVMERALYNGALSGVSLDGERFFYVNPLASGGAHHRQDWFDCACCPPNIARLLASFGSYIYSQSEDGLAVHLYVQGEAEATLADGTRALVRQQTRYPWEGAVRLTVDPQPSADFPLRLRIPGWCRNYALGVNGKPVQPIEEKGYACLRRTWSPGDTVELTLDMPVERMLAHPSAAQDCGRVALQRGPLVYCVEGVDHPVSVHQLALSDAAELECRLDPDLLGGIVVIEGEAAATDPTPWSCALYLPAGEVAQFPVEMRAIPYYAWGNRDPGEMTVWLVRH
jgi:hypothetical protein